MNETFEEMRVIAEKSFTARPKRFVLELCDEVDRLNQVTEDKFNEFYNIAIRPLEEENQRLYEENQRYCKALEEIETGWDNEELDGYDMFHIARKALAGEEK